MATLVEASYKVLLVGDSGVGKTALIQSLRGHKFSPAYKATIGIDFVEHVFEVDGARVELEIWDTAGQERFRSITRFQYRGTKGLLLVYDVTNKSSFDMLNFWLESIDKEIDQNNNVPTPVYIIGNKRDLRSERVISYAQGKKIAERTFVRGFMETSAKDTTNVKEAFQALALAVTEMNHPKIMNSYLTPEERVEKERRRMGHAFSSFRAERAKRQESEDAKSTINLKLNAIKTKASKCSC